MQSRLYHAGWKLLDVLFPPKCAGCGEWGDRYCPTCFEKTNLVEHPICQICGDTLPEDHAVMCMRCRNQPVAFTAIRSWGDFSEPLKSAIHSLKYHQDRGLGEVLAKPLVGLLRQYRWEIDYIVPVPLDSARRKERGFNQAALIARPISWSLAIPYSSQILFRNRITQQQVGLSLSERAENLADAFSTKGEIVLGKSVLVVDDVITTGATINSCAFALINGGAGKVYGITLARSSHT
jgi:ComF family protein